MIKPVSQRARWKNHERAVAKFFGVRRNVHGRGDAGTTRTDVVADISSTIIALTNSRFTRCFVECKYSHGINWKPFKIMAKFAEGTGAASKDHLHRPTPIVQWKSFLMFYLSDFDKIFKDVIANPHKNMCNCLDVISTYAIGHCSLKIPDYIEQYWDQVATDTKDYGNKETLPLVCLGNSSKKKIVLFNTEWIGF